MYKCNLKKKEIHNLLNNKGAPCINASFARTVQQYSSILQEGVCFDDIIIPSCKVLSQCCFMINGHGRYLVVYTQIRLSPEPVTYLPTLCISANTNI